MKVLRLPPGIENQDVVPGMVTSDEPGLYREGSHGIQA